MTAIRGQGHSCCASSLSASRLVCPFITCIPPQPLAATYQGYVYQQCERRCVLMTFSIWFTWRSILPRENVEIILRWFCKISFQHTNTKYKSLESYVKLNSKCLYFTYLFYGPYSEICPLFSLPQLV